MSILTVAILAEFSSADGVSLAISDPRNPTFSIFSRSGYMFPQGPFAAESLYWFNPGDYGNNGIGYTVGGYMQWATRWTIQAPIEGRLLECGVFIFIDQYGPMPEAGDMNIYYGTDTCPVTPLGIGFTWPPDTANCWHAYDCSGENIMLSEGEYWLWANQRHNTGQVSRWLRHGPRVQRLRRLDLLPRLLG